MPPTPPILGEGITGEKPREYRLDQNSPNPFNPTTTLSYTLPSKVHVSLRVYDLLGRVITTLVDKVEEEGEHRMRLDATGIPSGVYFYRLVAGDYTRTMKMVVLK